MESHVEWMESWLVTFPITERCGSFVLDLWQTGAQVTPCKRDVDLVQKEFWDVQHSFPVAPPHPTHRPFIKKKPTILYQV